MKILIFLLIALLTLPLMAQKQTGEWLINNAIIQRHLDSDIVGGNELVEGTWGWFFACDTTNSWSANAASGAAFSRDSLYHVFGFDADGGSTGDDYAHLNFVIPANYQVDSASVKLYWYHLDDDGAAADVVEWMGTCQAVGVGENLFAAGTAMTAVETICTASDSALYTTVLDIEVEAIAAGDLCELKIGVDESDSELDSGELAYLIGAYVSFYFKE